MNQRFPYPLDPKTPGWKRKKIGRALEILQEYWQVKKSDEKAAKGYFDAEDFLNWLQNKYRPKRIPGKVGMEELSAKRTVFCLSQVWFYWIEHGYVEVNSFQGYGKKKESVIEFETRVLRITIDSPVAQRSVAVMRIRREFGFSLREVAALDVTDFDREKGKLRVHNQWQEMSSECRKSLDDYVSRGRLVSLWDANETGLFVCPKSGGRMSKRGLRE